MNGKVTTSCLLFLLSAWAHVAESNVRGGPGPGPFPEAEQFRYVGGEINPLTTFQRDMAPFLPNLTSGFQFTSDGKTTVSTLTFQFSTGTGAFPSVPVEPFQQDSTKLF
jgi:hypothetical protein